MKTLRKAFEKISKKFIPDTGHMELNFGRRTADFGTRLQNSFLSVDLFRFFNATGAFLEAQVPGATANIH